MRVELHDVESRSRGDRVGVSVMLPDDVDASEGPLPLIINLHGGGGNRHMVEMMFGALYDRMWSDGTSPPCIVVSISAGVSMYLGYEDFIVHELPAWVAERYDARSDREGVCLTGLSMGGFGTAYLGFSHPERFCAIAMLEPAIEPSFETQPETLRNSYFRADEQPLVEGMDGGLDLSFTEVLPAKIARDNADAIRDSGMEIYLECGDEDGFNLHDGSEFLHRVLWDHDIRHEYHLVRWADHVGESVDERFLESHAFLVGALAGGRSTDSDMEVPEALMTAVTERIMDPFDQKFDPRDETMMELMRGRYGPSIQKQMVAENRAKVKDPDIDRAYGRMRKTS